MRLSEHVLVPCIALDSVQSFVPTSVHKIPVLQRVGEVVDQQCVSRVAGKREILREHMWERTAWRQQMRGLLLQKTLHL